MASLKELFQEWREDEALRKSEEAHYYERLKAVQSPSEKKTIELARKEIQQDQDIER